MFHALLQEYIKYCRYVFQNETIPNQVALNAIPDGTSKIQYPNFEYPETSLPSIYI